MNPSDRPRISKDQGGASRDQFLPPAYGQAVNLLPTKVFAVTVSAMEETVQMAHPSNLLLGDLESDCRVGYDVVLQGAIGGSAHADAVGAAAGFVAGDGGDAAPRDGVVGVPRHSDDVVEDLGA